MDVHRSLPLLGGLTPQRFMQRHWEKQPLLVRQAWPGAAPPASRSELFALAAQDDVESRLVERRDGGWRVRHGPLGRRALPPVSRPGWTLLVQGLDLHLDAARAMLEPFRFVPDARLDDLMVSWASDGGGVGPHIDAYDVFLLQVQGRRRWRVGPVSDPAFIDGLPLRILRRFEPEHEWVLEPGDLLYLPPMWGHDGIAEGECITCSIGFRSPRRDTLAADLLQRLSDLDPDADAGPLYRDPRQSACTASAAVPPALLAYAHAAVARRIFQSHAVARALGESLTEPKAQVWFVANDKADLADGVRLDRRSRMLHDERHVYLNGESYRVGGRDATLLKRLADHRALSAADCARLGPVARETLTEWLADGWLQCGGP